jgi:hypothetical protein
MALAEKIKKELLKYIKRNKKADLINFYLHYLEEKNKIKPILFPKEKKIYQSIEKLIQHLDDEKKLYRETEIKIQIGQQSVNEYTKKIYICPYTGKVFGDNTHPNPQDAIYDWVSQCPENKERVGGLPVKRFFVSEDKEVINNYMQKRKAAITKVVFSSVITGKLFNSKKAVIDDLKKNYIKPLSLHEVQNQNKFEIDDEFLNFLQSLLTEEKVAAFVEVLSNYNEFEPYLEKWMG